MQRPVDGLAVGRAVEVIEPALGLAQRAGRFGRERAGDLHRAGDDRRGVIDAFVREADLARGLAVDQFGIEEPRTGGAVADHLTQEWAGNRGGNTETRDGVAHLRVRVGDDKVPPAEQRAPARDGGALRGDDHRARALAEHRDHAAQSREERAHGEGVIAAIVEVKAGAEDRALAAEHDRADCFVRARDGGGLAQVRHHRDGERVALLGAVDDDRKDLAFVGGVARGNLLVLDADHALLPARECWTISRAMRAAFASASSSTAQVRPASRTALTSVSVEMFPGAGLSGVPA